MSQKPTDEFILLNLTRYELAALVSLFNGISEEMLATILNEIFKKVPGGRFPDVEHLKVAIVENLVSLRKRVEQTVRELERKGRAGKP